MDAVAALAAPSVVDLPGESLEEFLGHRQLRVVHLSDGRPFGLLLKALLHGRLGSELRCARMEVGSLEPDDARLQMRMASWVKLAGTGSFPPPAGYYLLRGKALLGYHPELPDAALLELASAGARGLLSLVTRREVAEAGRVALSERGEMDLLRFFEEAACGTTPRRAPAASDRRATQDRRGSWRGKGKGKPRRAEERTAAELDAACALLGVTPRTPLRQVKAARNRLLRDNHPDRLAHAPERQAEATALVVRLNEAWAVVQRAHDGAAPG